ncbi:MAG TPA: surface lipoprotein assembly modifier [Caulobacteraceae bacterium]|nr:surface lipoprotein assembly modifier [Caulobacteraceae bacterium]
MKRLVARPKFGARAGIAAAILSLIAAAPPPPAQAETVAKHLSAVDLFHLADVAREKGRFADAEAIYDALARDPNAEVRAEARFRHGMMLAALKRYREAAVLFRALLDEKPKATRVRLELARVLAAMGKEAEARRELRQAEAAGLPPDVAAVVNQFANALHSTQRYGGSIQVAVAPDSNINRATAARTLDTIIAPLTLSKDARQESGIGFQGGAQGYLRLPLTTNLDLLPRVSGQADIYGPSEFDDISGSAMLGLEWREAGDKFSPSAGETWRWYGHSLYATTQVVTFNWIHPLGERAQLDSQFSAGRARYHLNDLQDGWLYSGAMSYERALTPRMGASLTLDVTRETAADQGYATWQGGGTLLAWRDVGRTTFFVSAGVHRLEGDAQLFLFPDRRREWLYQASGGATLRRFTWRGFAPVVRVDFERNQSTVGLYDYRRFVTSMGVTGAF